MARPGHQPGDKNCQQPLKAGVKASQQRPAVQAHPVPVHKALHSAECISFESLSEDKIIFY